MHWEELTGDEFPRAVERAEGVCLVALGCIERHGHHLPLGTDMMTGRELCRRAAAIEPAVVFPDLYFTQILEARHRPGTIAVSPELMLRLLGEVCSEIARNGLSKIVLVNAHGGNDGLIRFFMQSQLATQRDYVLYAASPPMHEDDEAAVRAQWETTVDGHAGETETSIMLRLRPKLVRMDALPDDGEGMPQERLKALREAGIMTPNWWYADHPTHYRGDGRPGTAEKGDRFLDAQARALARAIGTIKEDTMAGSLLQEFYAASVHGARAREMDEP